MTDNPEPEAQNLEYGVEGVNPEVEARVDAMMSIEPPKPVAKSATNTKKTKIRVTDSNNAPAENIKDDPSKSSAPLLPDDALPDFDTKNNGDQEDAEIVDQPVDKKDQTVDESELVAGDQLTEDDITISPEQPIDVDEADSDEADKPKIILTDEIGVDDRATEAAVDEIIIDESDRILAVEDAKAELTKDGVSLYRKSFIGKIRAKIADFWANPTARRLTVGIILLSILAVFAVPASRYAILNLSGVRSSTSLRIVDEKTGQPLKNVEVSLSGQTNKTDIDGNVKLEKIKLGNQDLSAKKPAFADLSQKVIVGWGSNPMGDVKLTAVGSRYVFEAKDFLSGKPVAAEAVSGQYSARANDKGEIVLVVENEKIENIDIKIVAKDYRSEKLNLPVGSKQVQNLSLVPARKHAFVSKRDGRYDFYKIDADGKNEELVLKGTGKESEENMVILPNKNQNIVAFVSTRGEKYNKDGFALSSLNIIDLDTNESKKITDSERIQLVDFTDNKLVFVAIKAGQSAASASRHQLISYDIVSSESKELASANYFNDVLSARGLIYYSPAEYKINGQIGFYQIKPDGTGKYTILGEEVWNLFRVSYYKIDAAVGQDWYEYDIGSAQFNKLGGAPPVLKSRVYVDAPDSPNSIWVDDRDGKGVLLLYNTETNEADKVLATKGGLGNPIRWLDNDHVVYRVSDNQETADYVLSLSGGEPKKIIDVTNIAGLDRWYYY